MKLILKVVIWIAVMTSIGAAAFISYYAVIYGILYAVKITVEQHYVKV